MDTLAGYVAAGLIGVCLGMIGAGGSILTMPVLVYLFHVDPTVASAYSLFIVGVTAVAGAIQSAVRKLVDFRIVLMFGVPSILGTFITRWTVIPLIPDVIYSSGAFDLTRNVAIMMFFAAMMLAAGTSMLRRRRAMVATLRAPVYTAILGFLVGVLTGMVGAGGGFLIIPSLVLFAGLPMRLAVGTSLAVIAMKSMLGFGGDVLSGMNIDYLLMMSVAGMAVTGIFAGTYLASRIDAEKLKDGFGWFVVLMSLVIIGQQVSTM